MIYYDSMFEPFCRVNHFSHLRLYITHVLVFVPVVLPRCAKNGYLVDIIVGSCMSTRVGIYVTEVSFTVQPNVRGQLDTKVDSIYITHHLFIQTGDICQKAIGQDWDMYTRW